MPNEVEQLKKQFEEMSSTFSTMKKEFELKLESAQKDAKEYKEAAYKREEELRLLKEKSEKDAREYAATVALARETEIKNFVEAQVKAGRVAPAKREAIIAFMKSLTSDATVIEFAGSNGSKVSHNQLSLFKDLISGMKVIVPLNTEFTQGEQISTEVPSEIQEEGAVQFMEVIEEGVRKKFPIAQQDLDAKAKQYQEEKQKAGITVSYYDALIAVGPRNRKVTVQSAA